MYVVLLGPPGAGKGTQAIGLAERLGLRHISSGDLFRETVAAGGELGRAIKEIMQRGDLVPDSITVRMIFERLQRADCARGVVLDGFPRTVEQSVALEHRLEGIGKRLDAAILIDVPADVLVRRLSARWISRKTGRVFNAETLGQTPAQIRRQLDPDDELYQRPDDTPETVRRRIQVYTLQTRPLVDHFRSQGILCVVNGDQPVESVRRDLLRVLEALPRTAGETEEVRVSGRYVTSYSLQS